MTTAKYTENIGRRRLAQQAIEKRKQHKSVPRSVFVGHPMPKASNTSGVLEDQWQSLGESNPSFQVENLAS